MSSVVSETIADLLARGHGVRFTVTGDSMHPLIRSGDTLLIEPVAAADVGVGDVVLSLAQRGLTAHRVLQLAITGDGLYFTTRGDNAPATDLPFHESQLLGLVIETDRAGRTRPVRRLAGVFLRAARLMVRTLDYVRRRFGS